MFFSQDENKLCSGIERRIAQMTAWPFENGDDLQVLNYPPGAEYQPNYDYFDPAPSATSKSVKLGGQRVATLVIYTRRT
jgi:prolyl 4-hydroxylase